MHPRRNKVAIRIGWSESWGRYEFGIRGTEQIISKQKAKVKCPEIRPLWHPEVSAPGSTFTTGVYSYEYLGTAASDP